MSIAFFDLDLTLLSKNSATLWVKKEFREGHIGRLQALRAVGWMLRYQLGFSNMEDALEKAIASLEGSEEARVRARTYEFYDEEVKPLYRPGAKEALRKHREDGDKLVLLTSSSLYLSERVSRELKLDAILCNRFEVDSSGRYTGRSQGPLCFGIGKLRLASSFASAWGVSLSSCHFYTDSMSDLPVLEAVGSPVVVNPDPRLKREAGRRQWQVEDWGVSP